jgi:putative protease
MEEVGEITHVFPKISVAVVKVTGVIKIGDQIEVKGPSTDYQQEITSMQIDRKDIEEANDGEEIGLKVEEPVRKGDKIFLI